jgi:hypothetical protein
MQWHNDGREANRGTILIASRNALFADIVGEMVARCGFAPAYLVGHEASPMSLARTRPCIVICDCGAAVEGIQHLIADASSQRIPVMLSDTRMLASDDVDGRMAPERVAWLRLPISRDAFSAMLDELLARSAGAIPEAAASVAGITIDTDVEDLRSAIGTALAATPVYEQSLRRGVWTYVSAERDAGTSPGQVIMVLSELVDAARIVPATVSLALTRRMILWCVEAYFGQLGAGIGSRDSSTFDGDAPYPAPMPVSNR